MLHPHFFNAIPIYKMAVFFLGVGSNIYRYMIYIYICIQVDIFIYSIYKYLTHVCIYIHIDTYMQSLISIYIYEYVDVRIVKY